MDKMKRTISPIKAKEILNKDITENNNSSSNNIVTDKAAILEEVLHNLYDGLSDKEQSIRTAIQNAIVKILEIHPLQAVNVTLKFMEEEQSEAICIILLQAIEKMINSDVNIPYEVCKQLIAFALKHLTDGTNNISNISAIQKQAINILVAIARNDNCAMVMDDLMRHTKEGVMPHFMIMECYGAIATTNVMGVVPYVKPILKTIVNQLGILKNDHLKRTYAYAIGRFSEALLEQRSIHKASIKIKDKEDTEDHVLSPTSNEVQELLTDSTEISVAYDILYNQWLSSRDSQICLEVLKALSSLFPLLPHNKIKDQTPRLVPAIFNLYRRSLDRNAVTQFLSSVLETNLSISTSNSASTPSCVLDCVIDQLLNNLFDLVSMSPHYDKPYTLKGHYEVLRCFDLLSKEYPSQIMDILLIHLRSNSERERIKSLLILTHLLNTSLERIQNRLQPFLECIKTMVTTEKTINMKKTLQRTIVALSQKSYIKEREFIWFMVRHSCKYSKINDDYGTAEEYDDLMKSCENSLFMLSTTVGTMDELLKRELLNYFVLLDYTDICWNLAGCLASLFSKSPNIEYEVMTDTEQDNPQGESLSSKSSNVPVKRNKIIVPSAETIYVRCLALLGNYSSIRRTTNILSFLRYYYPHINPALMDLWEKSISDLLLNVNNKEEIFQAKLMKFITDTNDFLNIHDEQFATTLAHKIDEQMIMYPLILPQSDFVISPLHQEKGMLLKCLGLSLRHVKDPQIVSTKIDLIITAAKQERLEKNTKLSEFGIKIDSCALALGYASHEHLPIMVEKLSELIHLGDRKQSSGFFSNLNFMKDTHKELEKTNLLVIKTIGQIMITIPKTDTSDSLTWLTSDILNFLIGQLTAAKDVTIIENVLKTLLYICERLIQLRAKGQINSHSPLNCRKKIIDTVFNMSMNPPYDDLHMMPSIFKLGSYIVRLETLDDSNSDEQVKLESGGIFTISCRNFFTVAQNLKTKFESPKEDEFNSFLAQHLNAALPELNILVRTFVEMDPTPTSLMFVFSALEPWMRDENVEVRTCASRILNNCLDAHITCVKLDDEDKTKFTETGQVMAKIVPRCMDSNGTIRQLSVEILQQILIVASIYETSTVADNSIAWMKQIDRIKEQIITDNPETMNALTNKIGSIIAERISTFQYLQFCKNLLQGLKDPEESSAIGSAVVLKLFIEQKGFELFHVVNELVNDALVAIRNCKIDSANTVTLESLVALTKNHPKLMMNEMLTQKLPYEENITEYWHMLCTEDETIGVILEDFLQRIETSDLLEDTGQPQMQFQSHSHERQNIASVRLFAVFCALHEMMPCPKLYHQLNEKFAELFAMLLTSLATYTNVAAPMLSLVNDVANKNATKPISGKYKFGFIPNKDTVKLNPCQIVLETFQSFLKNVKIVEISDLLDQHTLLATSSNLRNFIEFLKKMVPLLQSSINSSNMECIVRTLSPYVSSTYENQRVAAIGFYSNLIHLKPSPVILTSIMEHCTHALSDPSPVVRGLSIQGMGYLNYLNKHDIENYIDVAITALLKGIDDSFSDTVINIPLESLCGLTRILQHVHTERMDSIQVSLGIRLRPFFGNYSLDIRKAAITLFGNLCERSTTSCNVHDAMREQLLANLFPLILHLSESEPQIVLACKEALLKVCDLLNSDKIKEMAYDHLNNQDQLNYYNFVHNFVKIIAMELSDHIQDFIDTCIPNLRSHWPDVRSSSAIVIGILNNFLSERNSQTDAIGVKIAVLLKDSNKNVRIHAATALGYFYGDI